MPGGKEVLFFLESAIIEDDARVKLMMVKAQSLLNKTKNTYLVVLMSDGQSAKTTFLRWTHKALGKYGNKVPIKVYAPDKRGAGDANEAKQAAKNCTYIYSEESVKGQKIDVGTLKEMINCGEFTNRANYGHQETFPVTWNAWIATNYPLTIETTDHGTWRRLLFYHFKVKFCTHPDPNNPFEKQEDTRFNKEFTDDPTIISAYFALLVHFYERLEREYGGDITKVKSPTIERETHRYRIEQDVIHCWISTHIVKTNNMTSTGGTRDEYTMEQLAGAYIGWYAHARDPSARLVPADIITCLTNSALKPLITTSETRRQTVVRGCRVLNEGEEPAEDESFLCGEWRREKYKHELPKIDPNWWCQKLEPSAPVDNSDNDSDDDFEDI